MTAATPDRRAIITEALHKIDDLTARLEIAEKSSSEPIAVIGMGCRFRAGQQPRTVLGFVVRRPKRHRPGSRAAVGRRRLLL